MSVTKIAPEVYGMLRDLSAAATPAPWVVPSGNAYRVVHRLSEAAGHWESVALTPGRDAADAALIAAYRTWMPQVIDETERLVGELMDFAQDRMREGLQLTSAQTEAQRWRALAEDRGRELAELRARVAVGAHQPAPGGELPQDKLSSGGALDVGIAVDHANHALVLAFGRAISWFALNAAETTGLILMLQRNLVDLERGPQT